MRNRSRVNKFDQGEVLHEIASMVKAGSRAPNIKKYKPHEKQVIFHKSWKKSKLYLGGNRSGKTTGGVCEDIWRATCTHPYRPDLNAIGPNFGRIVTTDFTNGVEKVLYPQFKQWLYPSALRDGTWEGSFDKESRTLYFSNGSTIEFMSYDQDLDKFAGSARHWIHFDEEPPKTIYGECLARLVDYDGDFWVTMTPVEGLTWVYEELYEPNVNNEDGETLVIEINTLENPYLSASGIERLVSRVDENETSTRIGGKFVSIGGRIYKEFDPTIGGPNVFREAFHEPALDFKDWLWILGLDHGLANPTAALWAAFDPNGFGVVFEEHYQAGWTIDQHARKINEIIKRHGRPPDLLVADPSIQNRNPVTGTSVQEEYQKFGLSFTLGNNDVEAGLVRVRRYLKPANYVGNKRHDIFKNSDSFVRLRVTPNCPKLIWELKNYKFKEWVNKKVAFENNPQEKPAKKNDHACDALRYLIMTQPDLRPDSNLNNVDDIMEKIGFGRSFKDIADPNDIMLDPTNPDNRIPSNGGGWTFDEHLGGIY